MKLLAALIFFTRLPFWRITEVPAAYFKRVVDYWPFVGWLTGGIMAGTLWLSAQFLPMSTAVILALLARLLVTGALHEDGLADFCDGFGGGTSREKILSIMKDSHIGTYGVLGLLFYFGLLWNLLSTLSLSLACMAVWLPAFIAGGLPMWLFLNRSYWWAALAPVAVFFLLWQLLRKRLQGYTGDCCGAAFLLCELSFYLIINLIYTNLW